MALDDTQRDWLTLTLVPGVGTTLFIRLLARFGTPGEVLRASEAALCEVVGPKLSQRIRSYREVVDVAAQERAIEQYGVHVVTLDDPAYPPRLAEIYDPPLVLFVRGELREEDQHCVAVVGTRKPSVYGLRMAEALGGDLAARGLTVVSGMAAGVDAAAQKGALDAGGRTVAVLGCGVDIVYPSEHAELMHRIIQHGCALSSFPMGVKPARGHFPARNRIISGLSMGTVVVEAPPGSGALITARNAAEQGREVFAVPGRAGDRNSLGPHSLIREGAKLVENIEDILVELELPADARVAPMETPGTRTYTDEGTARAVGELCSGDGGRGQGPPPQREMPAKASTTNRAGAPSGNAGLTPAQRGTSKDGSVPGISPEVIKSRRDVGGLSKTEREVLAALSGDGSFVDEIALVCRIPVSEALSALTMLELKGLVRQYSGKRFLPTMTRAYTWAERIRRGEPIPAPLGFLLEAATPVTRLGMAWRLHRPRTRVEARVISLGNITAGGTGKTPAVIERAQRELDAGRRVAVLTRGYGSGRRREPVVITPGSPTDGLVDRVGDEAAVILRRVPEVTIVKGADRVAGARVAIDRCNCDTLILDDGFQHVMLERDENILVIDATNPFGNGRLLPRGILREPLDAMCRATAIVLTRCDQVVGLDILESQVRLLALRAPIRKTRHAPSGLWRVEDGEALPLDFLAGKDVTAACAIGNPEAFFDTLASLGACITQQMPFRDHAHIPGDALPHSRFRRRHREGRGTHGGCA